MTLDLRSQTVSLSIWTIRAVLCSELPSASARTDLPLDVIGAFVASTSPEAFIAGYEASRRS